MASPARGRRTRPCQHNSPIALTWWYVNVTLTDVDSDSTDTTAAPTATGPGPDRTSDELFDRLWAKIMSRASQCDDPDEAQAVQALRTVLTEDWAASTVKAGEGTDPTPHLLLALAVVAARAHRLLGFREQTEVHRLAQRALYKAIDDDMEAAWQLATEAFDIDEGSGVVPSLLTWCDMYGVHATDGRRGLALTTNGMGHLNAATGEMMEGDDPNLPPEMGWAGRMVTARIEMNDTMIEQCLRELGEQDDIGPYCGALLSAIGHTMRTLPKGWAWLGRS